MDAAALASKHLRLEPEFCRIFYCISGISTVS